MRFSTALLVSGLAATSLAEVVSREEPRGQGQQDLYTLELEGGEIRQVTDEERWQLRREHVHFFDVTYEPETAVFAEEASIQGGDEVSILAYPTAMTQVSAVNALIAKYSKENLQTNLRQFSSYYNRYYRATTGVQSAQWLFDTVSGVITAAKPTAAVTVRKVSHTFGNQFSIVATIPGKSAKTVVVGAHQDSINGQQATGPAAGADDDGSGTVAILEAFRVLLTDTRIASGQGANTLEFHWYAAEEAGLLGSQAIFQQYAREGKQVAAMLNQDMVGYSRQSTMGLITDNTNVALNTFTKAVLSQYVSIPFVETRCGYACSDHASATRSGYPSSFVFEASFDATNPSIHTPQDTIDKINFDHAVQHGRLILGFMTELAFAANI